MTSRGMLTQLKQFIARVTPEHAQHWQTYEQLSVKRRAMHFGIMAVDCTAAMQRRLEELVIPVEKPASVLPTEPAVVPRTVPPVKRPLQRPAVAPARSSSGKKARVSPAANDCLELFCDACAKANALYKDGDFPSECPRNNRFLMELLARYLTAAVVQLSIQEALSRARGVAVTNRGAAEHSKLSSSAERVAARLALQPLRVKESDPGLALRTIMSTHGLLNVLDLFNHLGGQCNSTMDRDTFDNELLIYAAQACTSARKFITLPNMKKGKYKYRRSGDKFHGDWLRELIPEPLLTLNGQITVRARAFEC